MHLCVLATLKCGLAFNSIAYCCGSESICTNYSLANTWPHHWPLFTCLYWTRYST